MDNESARLALLKCYSPSLPSLKLITECLSWDQAANSHPWYARVPTFSNIADGPSRMTVPRELREAGAKIVQPVLDAEWLKRVRIKKGFSRTL